MKSIFLKCSALYLFFFIQVIVLLLGCGTVSSGFSIARKFAPEQLQKDYTVYRGILEAHHPGLYWYTPKDSMDFYFEQGYRQLKDSLTEPEFRKVLTWVTAKINCGHTTIRSSKAWSKFSDTVKPGKMFPLSVKVWEDAMVVTANLNRKDSILKRGTEILKINGNTRQFICDTLFHYISTDGYNRTHKYQVLSNRGFLGSLYTSIFGISEKYDIEYKDSLGRIKSITIPVYNPETDTAGGGIRNFQSSQASLRKKQKREQQRNNVRLLRIDTVNKTAMMNLATFSKGYRLKKFFHDSFRALARNQISHLIVDLRSNGGGSVSNFILLTRYIARDKFKIADSLYAIRNSSRYRRYIKNCFWNMLFITFFTKKRENGRYHFRYFESHRFKPKVKNHYKGKVYILTGGNTFSASTLFVSILKRQDNVTVVGEETGGAAYGNSAWLIPDVTLPETGVRFRLPLFRLVIDKSIPKDGRGVLPEVESLPTVEDIRRNADFKVLKAMELIKKDKQ